MFNKKTRCNARYKNYKFEHYTLNYTDKIKLNARFNISINYMQYK